MLGKIKKTAKNETVASTSNNLVWLFTITLHVTKLDVDICLLLENWYNYQLLSSIGNA